MASISNDPNGRRRISFIGADKKRKAIRLGKVPMRYAESVKVKIEDLVRANIHGHAPLDETSRWLVALDSTLHDKLAIAGLIKRREVATLGEFTRAYIDGRVDIKPRTRINLEQARTYLVNFFDPNRPLRDFNKGDAEDFRLHLIGEGKKDNTVRRAIGRARQFFKAAIQREMLQANPFEGIAASVRPNPSRFYFVSRDEAEKVLANCPDTQWQLIFALARFGGLRCPSEVLALTWADVNWEEDKIRVPSPKTEHLEGMDCRIIPMFPELRPLLLKGFEEAEPGAEHVITRYRDKNSNLRTQLQRIIQKAGLESWARLFQNLRSTRETELAEKYPIHVVCKWIGNSESVAAKHYLQLTDEHFASAIKDDKEVSNEAVEEGDEAAQNAAQKAHETTGNDPKPDQADDSQAVEDSTNYKKVPEHSETFSVSEVPPTGVEPVLPA